MKRYSPHGTTSILGIKSLNSCSLKAMKFNPSESDHMESKSD